MAWIRRFGFATTVTLVESGILHLLRKPCKNAGLSSYGGTSADLGDDEPEGRRSAGSPRRGMPSRVPAAETQAMRFRLQPLAGSRLELLLELLGALPVFLARVLLPER